MTQSQPTIADTKPILIDLEPGTYYWCSCGESSKQPFCDGSHSGTEFAPLKIEIDEAKKEALCQCKYTKNPPFCDGSHSQLS
ncbi:CDGSH iron-sulfur domain-containing protein [Oscillatoriales cyanobacterium LEGE 11467]|uniref:CDGSH iron-sulfur domain-containing protein n=1 Tax=Zarconia navalis LEGE 11467 TaxID=1828826 RepID=A0A928VV56_9CYAN|nr:CDGSH iron-sulfur domain-containing protein [Zarconia navalis]MBE9040731.1 CDGSH iron-sulfur domain-containing protein [Zarconia navalis LEGE 11467]